MRMLLIVSLATGFAVGCASQKKNDAAPAPAPAQATTEKAKADAKNAVKDAKAAAKETKKAVQEAAAKANTAANEGATKVECKIKGDVRALEVRTKDKGCEIAYTKAGQENVVGSSQNGTAHCEGILNKIKEKLTAAGYACE